MESSVDHLDIRAAQVSHSAVLSLSLSLLHTLSLSLCLSFSLSISTYHQTHGAHFFRQKVANLLLLLFLVIFI
jgi:hypothetical protein